MGAEWSCARRELPSEKHKVTCDTLRNMRNLYKNYCSSQYTSEAQCNGAFTSQDNAYRPCVWHAESNACEESGQVLACDCALLHKNCPHHEVVETAPVPGSGDGDDVSSGDGLIVAIAVIIIVGGCGGLAWFFFRKSGSDVDESSTSKADDVDDDGEGELDAMPKKRKKKKDRAYGAANELESVEL